MNCSDISLMLDDRDTSALEDEQRKAVDAHLAGCRDCARDWTSHARLVGRKLPALPPDLVDECSALAVGSAAMKPPRSSWRRAAVAASVAVLAVAAAALTFYGVSGNGSPEVVATPGFAVDPQDSSVLADTPAPSRNALQAQVNTPPAVQDAAKPDKATGSSTSTVRVSTLPRDNTLQAADEPIFDAFRAAVISELRRTPGLVLSLAESSATDQVDYEIMLGAVRRNDRLNGILRVRKSGPNAVVQPIQGAFGQDCAPSCFQDAASLGEALARTAAKMMMPPAVQRSALLEELRNASLPPDQRLAALRELDLRRASSQSGPRWPDPGSDSLRDPAIVLAAIDLAAVATTPAQRAEIWWTMRSIRNPALVEPLAHAAQLDPDSTVRAEAAATLALDYAGDPRARAAFELITRMDSHPLVRALAQRGLSGEQAWSNYVRASLKDTALPDAQRLDAVLFHARSSPASEQQLAGMLDGDALKALAQTLTHAREAGTQISGVRTLLNNLRSVKHPAITAMLLAGVERQDPQFDRRQVMQMLAERVSEPGARAALEKIAAADPDEQSRAIAARALQDEK